MKYIYCFLSVLILVSNCTNKKTESDNETQLIRIDLNKTTSIHDINLIDSIDIIRLDNDVVFGRINKIIKNDNYFFLLDAYISNSIIVYDMDGNLVKKISDIGQGPEEYLQPTDIYIDQDEKILGLISRMDKKLLKYNLDNFNLKSLERLPKPFFYLINTNSGYIGSMNNCIDDKPYNLWTLSKSLELEEHFFEIPSSWDSKSSGTIQPFSKYDNNIYYIQPHDFQIYCMNDNKKKIVYRFDFGENTWPSNIVEYGDVEETRKNSSNKYIEDLRIFQETQDYILIKTVFKNQNLLGAYDKKTGKSHVVYLDAYTDKYFIPFGDIIGIDENAIYSLVPASSIKKNIIGKDEYNDFESEYPVQIENLRSKFKNISIDEEDNPFLIIHYL